MGGGHASEEGEEEAADQEEIARLDEVLYSRNLRLCGAQNKRPGIEGP